MIGQRVREREDCKPLFVIRQEDASAFEIPASEATAIGDNDAEMALSIAAGSRTKVTRMTSWMAARSSASATHGANSRLATAIFANWPNL